MRPRHSEIDLKKHPQHWKSLDYVKMCRNIVFGLKSCKMSSGRPMEFSF